MHRYLAFFWDPDDLESSQRVGSLESALLLAPPWALAYKGAGVLIIHQSIHQRSPSVHSLTNSRGVVLGCLFRQNEADACPRAIADFSEAESDRVSRSHGRELVQHYWGSYLAVLHDPQSKTCTLIRDPTANLACYSTKCGGVRVYFSDLGDLTRHVSGRLSINWTHMATRLLAGFSYSRDCATNEVEDIPGGEQIILARGTETRVTLWHPAQFCVEDGLESEERAALALRSTVTRVTQALASEHTDILVLLSGGLDSSIIASCLAARRELPNITCLNFFIAGDPPHQAASAHLPGLSRENAPKIWRAMGSADEREYARKVADRWSFRLIERERLVRDLDFPRLYNAPLSPRPTGYGFVLDIDDGECECAAEIRATACFSGQGGDSVFYATQRVLGALDYAFLHPFGPRIVHQVFSAVTLSREHLLHVVGKVVKYGYFRSPLPLPFEPTLRPSFLRAEIAASVPKDYFRHPWLDAATRLCPGKQSHVFGITASVPSYENTYRREQFAPSINPLASQPVVETCLRIPTYVLLAGGVSRGLARHTFHDVLPEEVHRRTVKGSGMGFNRKLVRRNAVSIREHLLEGPLVKEKLLDRNKLEAYLIDEQPFLSVQPEQIMDYLACDAWVTQLNSM